MSSGQLIEEFLAQKRLAVVGVSRKRLKIGRMVYQKLKTAGYHVSAVNPHAETIGPDRCYAELSSLPEPVDGIVTVVPPGQTEAAVRQAADLGIRRVWMQPGSESNEAIRLCQEHDLSVIHGECILMFAEPVRHVHALHRWIRRLVGKLPR